MAKQRNAFRDFRRYKQVAYWIEREHPTYFNGIRIMITQRKQKNALRYFYSTFENKLQSGTRTWWYLYQENVQIYGKQTVLSNFWRAFFARTPIIQKTKTIKRKTIREETTKFKKVTYSTEKKKRVRAEIIFVIVKGKPITRARSLKTGKFVAIPKKYKKPKTKRVKDVK